MKPDDFEPDLEADDLAPEREIEAVLGPDQAGVRLDKALAEAVTDLSRARLQALIDEGAVTLDGAPVTSGSAKAKPGTYRIAVPAPAPAEPEAEAIPLSVLYEDAHLIVLDKASGMAVHPAPGCERGTLVNALLHHCAGSLSGVGGVARPGIVHRLDKDTSGVMVAAKTDAAHAGLSALFARHDIERVYVALTRGAPQPARGTVETRIGRSLGDRKKMAVLKSGGREAVTFYKVERAFGPADKPLAARVACRLQTGRTHQIRVHMAHKGAPCLGDPVYGSGKPARPVQEALEASGLGRQALHAAVLGFVHPVTGEAMRFETPLPADMAELERRLAEL
ncbi:RluA family pseudouridine synthase [Caulobacter sp. 17J65-9]|uniref:RluA family pseudouridine synthase n=1 Tax=Caulobacter sp. 17J65-9 TaxID=2709382 RepID=UPI0013CA6EFD|nr:RluA family pseudouridine synthase [Caulobacter sp. 17J65-9]NEX92335.1 RluA family pseudouridine synthase [Caulobacter sp. 17J65-9]